MAMQETVICTISSQTRLATSDLPFFPTFASYQAAELLHLRLELPSESRILSYLS